MMKVTCLSVGGQLLIYQIFRMSVSFSTPSFVISNNNLQFSPPTCLH
jgi:hypothetical protein